MYVFIIFLSGLDISLHVNSPCRAEGSRTELSVVGGGRELESCDPEAFYFLEKLANRKGQAGY